MASYTQKKAALEQRIKDLEAKRGAVNPKKAGRVDAKLASARETLAVVQAKIDGVTTPPKGVKANTTTRHVAKAGTAKATTTKRSGKRAKP